jgi:hypothetical protein
MNRIASTLLRSIKINENEQLQEIQEIEEIE